MLAQIISGAVLGVDAYPVRVEVDLARGLPSMSVVGLPQGAVREGRERVTAALTNSGFELPPKRITINLAPADVPKSGSAFDLPIALGVLAAAGKVPGFGGDGGSGGSGQGAASEPGARSADLCFIGELGLDGALRPVHGALAVALRCREDGVGALVVPDANAAEAAVVEDVDVFGARTLADVVRHLNGASPLDPVVTNGRPASHDPATPDFADVRGQGVARRALEIAAAGGHNVLLVGPPGAGKSMMARRLPSILPPLTHDEALAATRVHSVAGRLPPGSGLLAHRPFRAPHHAVSDAGLVGGGGIPRPGEASLAHHGVLFLDELPEFRRSALESLRQPLEDGSIHIGRARAAVRLPARFMLVAAMNPCPCGHHGDDRRPCTCSEARIRNYRARVSGPLLDRIDLHVAVPAARPDALTGRQPSESSAVMRQRVLAARERQLRRYRGADAVHGGNGRRGPGDNTRPGVFCNAQLGPRGTREHCRLEESGAVLLEQSIRSLGLSGRAYHRILRVARTIADLDGAAAVDPDHLAEAIQHRTLDRPVVAEDNRETA